jgi:hypothetical protein
VRRGVPVCGYRGPWLVRMLDAPHFYFSSSEQPEVGEASTLLRSLIAAACAQNTCIFAIASSRPLNLGGPFCCLLPMLKALAAARDGGFSWVLL